LDIPVLVAYRNDPVVLRFQSWASYSTEDAAGLVAAMASSRPGIEGEWHQWAIESEGALVGDIGLRTSGREGEIGFTLAPAARGRGLALAAARQVLACAFEELEFERVAAGIDPANRAAAALLERLGFRQVGVERILLNGTWVDDEHWVLLAEEFRSQS
jgi:aminoglycoside 6'-N-acetyltransferase